VAKQRALTARGVWLLRDDWEAASSRVPPGTPVERWIDEIATARGDVVQKFSTTSRHVRAGCKRVVPAGGGAPKIECAQGMKGKAPVVAA